MTSQDYRASHQQPGKGEAYDRYVATNPHRAMVWHLEQRVLRQIADSLRRQGPVRLLDFACGTGRVLQLLEGLVDHAVGVDISEDMLGVARRKLTRSELLHWDLTQGDLPGQPRFNMITAFRFFPNAEPQLRHDAMRALVRHLDRGGILVFNNHRHAGSLLERCARMTGGAGKPGVTDREMHALAEGSGLRLVAEYGLALLPLSERRLQWLVPAIRPLEALAAGVNAAWLRRYCQNVIYVYRNEVAEPAAPVA